MAGFVLRPLENTSFQKTFLSIKKSENKLCWSTFGAASLRRADHQMMGLGQSLQDPQSLMTGRKPWGNLPGSYCSIVCRSGAEVSSTRRRSPCINLRLSLRVGAWNVLSQREDDHLSLLSSEHKRLDIGIGALSDVRRPDCGEIMARGYTYDWSGCSDCFDFFWIPCRGSYES